MLALKMAQKEYKVHVPKSEMALKREEVTELEENENEAGFC